MMTLVTGATGLLGNNVVRLLLQRNQPVRVLARATSDTRPLDGLDVETVHGDIRDGEQVLRATQGVSCVVNCAAWVRIGWKDAATARAVNVEGARTVAEAARDAGARLVHVSTVNTLAIGSRHQPSDEDTEADGQVPCPYVVTKREGESAVTDMVAEGLDAVIVNPGFMLGPWDWKPSSGAMLLRIAKKWTPYVPRGGCSVCDVRDVADGILAAAKQGQTGRRYILAGENMTYHDLAHLCAAAAGKGGPWRHRGPIFPLVMKVTAGWCNLRRWITGGEGDINSASIRMSSQFHYYSSARAESELDYKYRPAGEAVEAAWQWFQEHGYV